MILTEAYKNNWAGEDEDYYTMRKEANKPNEREKMCTHID